MWAIRDFAGRYFSDDGWTDRTRDALLYATCDDAERTMQDNGIVDAYCSWAGGDMDWCATCVRWDDDAGRCSALSERPKDAVCVGYEYAGPGDHSVAGGQDKPTRSGGTVERICLHCSHYDPLSLKCHIRPSYDNFSTHDSSCESFSAKSGEPSQPAEQKMTSKLKKNSLYGKQATGYRRYRHGSIECIDAIRAALTPEEFRGFCKGNIMKYVWRERHKGGDADLDKARDYVGYAVAGDTDGEL